MPFSRSLPFPFTSPSAADAFGPLMTYGSTASQELKPSPIEPSWILGGEPVARSLNLAKADDTQLSCGLWDCTAGTFQWIFGCDEIVHILEGEVTVQDEIHTRTLRPGDVAFFPQGLETIWHVPHYVKKFAIHRSVTRPLANRIASKVKSLVGRFAGAARSLVM